MLVAGLSGAVIGLLVWSSPPAGSAPGDELLPDLRVEQPGEIYIAKGKKAVRLRTSNSVSNVGAGPLEIYSGDEDDLCGAGGVRTFQRIFEDTVNTPGYFNRKNPAEAESFETVDSGCSRYHPAHDHWHFDNFARYTLVRESNGAIVGKSKKVSFCVIDTGRPHPGLPGSPGESYYPQDPEGGNPQFPTCSATSVDGLSIGWEDTYGAALPGQGINITGLRGKRFCLVLETDPPAPGLENGALVEEHEDDNVYVQRLRTTFRKEIVKPVDGACKAPL